MISIVQHKCCHKSSKIIFIQSFKMLLSPTGTSIGWLLITASISLSNFVRNLNFPTSTAMNSPKQQKCRNGTTFINFVKSLYSSSEFHWFFHKLILSSIITINFMCIMQVCASHRFRKIQNRKMRTNMPILPEFFFSFMSLFPMRQACVL